MHSRLFAHALLLAVTACTERPTAPATSAAATLAPAISSPEPGAAGGAAAKVTLPASLDGATLSYLRNGNLVLVHTEGVFLFDGFTWRQRKLPRETSAALERAVRSEHESLVIGGKAGWGASYEALELLSPVDLHEIYRGLARMLDGGLVVPAATRPAPDKELDDEAVVLVHETSAVRLVLPAGPGPREVTAVHTRAAGDVAVVSWRMQDGAARAHAYRFGTGAPLGPAAPLGESSLDPTSSVEGELQYYIALAPPRSETPRLSQSSSRSGSFPSNPPPPEPPVLVAGPPGSVWPTPSLGYDAESGAVARSVVVRDLAKQRTLRQRTIPCRGFLGNPVASPDGLTLLVTCGNDGVVLDARTLTERRRIPNVIPGCDNGMALDGRILPGAPILLVEGCGGIAKLDLGSGRYLCGDDAGVMGAPYDAMAPGTTRRYRKPSAPRCTPSGRDEYREPLGARGDYAYMAETQTVLGSGGARFTLEPDASTLVLSADESRLAYLTATTVVVRALPSGAVESTFGP